MKKEKAVWTCTHTCCSGSGTGNDVYLLFGDGHVVLHVTKNGGLDEVASLGRRPTPTKKLGPLPLAAGDVAQDLVELLFVHLRQHKEQEVRIRCKP